MGAGSAWADQITATLDHTGSSSRDGSNAITTTVDVEKEHYNNTKAAAWGGWAYAQFSFAIPEGQGIKSATLTWSTSIGGTAGKNRDNSIYYLNAGTSIDWESLTATTNLNLTGNGTLITTKNLKAGSEGNPQTTDVTDAVKAVAASQTFIIFEWTNSASGADLWGKKSTQAPTLVIETVSADSQTTYTVKYTDGTNELKAAQTYNVIIGEQYTASAADMASFVIDGKKWIYASGNTTATSVADAASNVITLVFREAATYNYALVSNLGGNIATGSNFEGENVSVAYPRYTIADSKLYEADPTNKEYRKTFALTADNVSATVEYKEKTGVNAVFCSEGENIEGMTASTSGNLPIRGSNAQGGVSTEDVTITTLPVGKYVLHVGTFTSKTSEQIIYIGYGETQYAFASSGNLNESASEEFTLTEETAIKYFGTTSSADAQFDYIWIQKTGDVTADEIALAEAKAALKADIDAAKAIDTTGKKNAESLASAILVAETHLNDAEATAENLQAAQAELAKVVEAYYIENAKNIFLKPGVWNVDGARFAAYVWDAKGNTWFDFYGAEGDSIYTTQIPEYYSGLTLVRLDGATVENNWDNKWNQTADIDFTAVADSTLFTTTGWGEEKSPYETSKYVKAEPVLNTYTAKFKTNAAWDKVYAYTWTGEGEGKVEQLGTWPGTEITETINDDNDDYDIYTATINTEAAPAYIIFNNGNENGVVGKTKTADLAFEDGQQYELMITVSELMQEAIDLAADDEAVAVGKLLEAIKWAYDNDDESKLQAAIDQFKADNAESSIDLTNKVGTAKDNWTGAGGTVASVTTKAGTSTPLAELYASSGAGVKMSQTITGLENGLYRVKVFATSHNARGEDGATLSTTAEDVAYVFATSGEVTNKTWITARGVSDWFVDGELTNPYTIEDITVSNGELTIGLALDKAQQTGWHSIQIYSLEEIATAKAAYAATKANMTDEIAAANAMKNAYRTEGLEAINAAIEAAETTLTSNMLNVAEMEGKISDLKAAMNAFRAANYVAVSGSYYVQNVATGKFMISGHDYGTRGIVDETGFEITLKANENNTVDFDTQIFNGDSKHFLGSNLYMDSDSWGWIIEKAGEDVYTISNGTQYIGVDAEDNLVLQSEAANWKFVTREDRIAALNAATEENGIDATFLIQGANFSRGDGRVAASWSVSDDCINKNLQGGAQTNMCAESWHSTFTIMQTIDGAPAGLYKMTAQGFYRQDEFEGDAPAAPQFFANDVNKDVPVRTGSENSMSDASASFTAGNYTIEPIDFVVTKEGDNAGKIYVGITNQNNTQWVIWDNFQLTYYGPAPATTYTVTVAETQNGTVEVDKTEAAENETVSVTVTPADGYMVDEAYWTYGEGENETKTQIGEPAEGNTATFTMPAANVTITVTFKAEPVLNPYTATFTTDYDWAEVYAYAWSGTEGQEGFKKFLGDWPGTKLEKNVETGLYTVTIEAEAAPEYIIFNNGNGGEGNQTTDLAFEDGKAYKFNQPAVLPEGAIYMWESPEGETVELGGKVTGVNNEDRINYQQAGYYTICLRGSADYSSQYVTITLDDGFTLNAGDEIEITAFRNKNETGKRSGAKLQFDGGASVTTGDGTEFVNLHNAVEGDAEYSTEPNTVTVTVPEGVVDCKTIKITRSQTSTNLFISKLLIKDLTTTGISNINADVQVEGIYNLRGQKVEKAQKGLYIINGKKVVIK